MTKREFDIENKRADKELLLVFIAYLNVISKYVKIPEVVADEFLSYKDELINPVIKRDEDK